MKNLFFGSESVRQGDFHGEELFAEKIVAPKWYWIYCFLCSFFGLVWQVWDSYTDENGYKRNYRIGFICALQTAWIITGKEIKYSKWICRYF
jgi:hypothetical protein